MISKLYNLQNVITAAALIAVSVGCGPELKSSGSTSSSSLSCATPAAASTSLLSFGFQKQSYQLATPAAMSTTFQTHQLPRTYSIYGFMQGRNTGMKKLQLDQSGAIKAQSKGQKNVSPTKELVAIVDHECTNNSSLGEKLGSSLIQQSQTAQKGQFLSAEMLRYKAVAFQVEDEISEIEFESELQDDPCVLIVGENQTIRPATDFKPMVFTDSASNLQGHLTSLNYSAAYDKFYAATTGIGSSQEVVIAVLDTGVSYTHPDLVNNMWTNASGQFGYDFVSNDTDPMPVHNAQTNQDGHGTHVAGLASAEVNNATGGLGIMGKNVKIMAVRVLSSTQGTVDMLVNGINYAVQNGADVINMSLGAEMSSTILKTTMQNAVATGVVLLGAAGNETTQITATRFFIPAAYSKDIDGLIGVAAVDSTTSTVAAYSNYSSTYLELAAPGSQTSWESGTGTGLYSTYWNGTSNTYLRLSGTSMATPVVAGAAGLIIGMLRSHNKTFTAADIETILKSGSPRVDALCSKVFNGHSLDMDELANKVTTYINTH